MPETKIAQDATEAGGLIARLEAATENTPELFHDIGVWADANIDGFSLFRWDTFIAAEVYTDAARSLVPEGYEWVAGFGHPKGGDRSVCFAMIAKPFTEGQAREANAATPELALTIIALQARLHEAEES